VNELSLQVYVISTSTNGTFKPLFDCEFLIIAYLIVNISLHCIAKSYQAFMSSSLLLTEKWYHIISLNIRYYHLVSSCDEKSSHKFEMVINPGMFKQAVQTSAWFR
jgi:Ni,Fe-hydrogenase I cytochrome b subunit